MQNKRLFLDIHAIQTLPPSNINRDDTGSPKTAQYGGITRARVSSQSWKKAMRDYFKETSDAANVGTRSLDVVRYLAGKIQKEKDMSDEEALNLAETAFNALGIKTSDKKVKALFFLGNSQAMKLAKVVVSHLGADNKLDAKDLDKKVLSEILRKNPAIDIALFGRMVADNPSLNEDASSQVAHAISTHPVQTEFDFFTAVDDLAPEDNAGAGMLGTIEFNSSTLYRYANVSVHELSRQLKDKDNTLNTLKLYIEAFAKSLPTGKVNTFANQTLPQALVVSLREDRPVNLVTAFEEAIHSQDGYVKKSLDKLYKEYEKVEKFVEKPCFTLYTQVLEGSVLEGAIEEDSLATLLKDFEEKMQAYLPEVNQD